MTKKQIYLAAIAVLIVAAGAELCGVHLHSPKWWPLPFGYDIFFGFVSCWVLIILAKIIMMPLLQRDETYYENRGEDDE